VLTIWQGRKGTTAQWRNGIMAQRHNGKKHQVRFSFELSPFALVPLRL